MRGLRYFTSLKTITLVNVKGSIRDADLIAPQDRRPIAVEYLRKLQSNLKGYSGVQDTLRQFVQKVGPVELQWLLRLRWRLVTVGKVAFPL